MAAPQTETTEAQNSSARLKLFSALPILAATQFARQITLKLNSGNFRVLKQRKAGA
jgi:hypothetical protein